MLPTASFFLAKINTRISYYSDERLHEGAYEKNEKSSDINRNIWNEAEKQWPHPGAIF